MIVRLKKTIVRECVASSAFHFLKSFLMNATNLSKYRLHDASVPALVEYGEANSHISDDS